MPNNRDEFTSKVRRTLQERVGNCCSNPDCRITTSGPNIDPDKATHIGVAAHIKAAAPGGSRFDQTMTLEERKSPKKGDRRNK